MRHTGQYTLILSRDDFYDAVVGNLRNLPLQGIFCIEDWYIDRLIKSWTRVKFDEEYKKYIFGLLMVSDKVGKLDSELCIWNITRSLVDELIICLAEGFYYDNFQTTIGENLMIQPFERYPYPPIDDEQIKYFLDIIDTIYGRVEVGTWDTLTWLRNTLGEDYLT